MTRLVMALFLLVSLRCLSQSRERPPLVEKITLNGDNLGIEDIEKAIREQTRYNVGKKPSITTGNPRFIIHVQDIPVESLFHLPALLALKIYCLIKGGKIVSLLRKDPVWVCEVRAFDSRSVPQPGTSVTILQGKDSLTWMTDEMGRLFFAVTPGPYALRITHMGFQPFKIDQLDSATHVNAFLKPAYNDLDMVVLSGYTSVSARDNTGSPSNIKLPESERASADNIQDGLKARVTSLAITAVNGVPGSGQIIRIRGRNSITQSNSPLFVIDGVPLTLGSPGMGNVNSASALGSGGISPLNIFSMNMIGDAFVLKDAASTALYGSRGANGVIVIHTDADTAGKEKWTVGAGTGPTWISNIQNPLPTPDYLALRTTALLNDGQPVDGNTLPEGTLWDSTRYTNFKKLLIGHPGSQIDVNARFLQKDKSGYVLLKTFFHRETAVFLDHPADNRLSLSGHFSRSPAGHHYALQGSLLYTLDDQHLPVTDYTNFITLTPNTPSPYGTNGQLSFQQNGLGFANYRALSLNRYEALTHVLFGHLQWTDTLGRNLILKFSGGFNSNRLRETVFQPAVAQNPLSNPYNIENTNHTSYTTVVAEPMMEYHRKINKKDSLDALLGFSWQQQVTRLTYLLTEYGLNAPSGAAQGPVNSGAEYRYEAIFAQIHYLHDNRYIVDFSFRRDGSSRFGPGRQFGNFGAAGAGWIFSHIRPLKDNRLLSWGKLRANYGIVGNDQIGDYQYLSLWDSTRNGYRGATALSPVTAYNPNLGWEIHHQFEGGLDLGLLNNRLFLSTSFYRNWSGNQLVFTPLSGQTGAQSILANIPARVLNTGLEFELTAHLVSTRNWQWNLGGTLTIPQNKLVTFPGLATSSLYANLFTIGKPLSELTGYVYTGVNAGSGLFTFLGKQNSKVTGPIGNTEMVYYGGLSSSLSYKAFSMDMLWEFRKQSGLSALPQLYAITPPGMSDPSGFSNTLIDPKWYWKKPGDHPLLQKPTATPGTAAWSTIGPFMNSSAQITDASFIRLNSVSFGYRLGNHFLQKCGCKEGKIYLEGKNLLTLTSYLIANPETQSILNLPPLRTIRCGIRLKF